MKSLLSVGESHRGFGGKDGNMKLAFKKEFTLIELLVVIAIITTP